MQKEDPRYQKIDLTVIDENLQPELANRYDYYYVPTFFVGGIKVHEGVASKEIVRTVLERSLH